MKIRHLSISIGILCSLHILGCEKNGTETKIDQEGIELLLRPDAVEPEAPIDIAYFVNSVKFEKTKVAAGELVNLGKVQPNTKVVFQVRNNYGAGSVRANILTNECFRKTGKCDGANCLAEAEYIVIEESCLNY
jgi:hypothetical protein